MASLSASKWAGVGERLPTRKSAWQPRSVPTRRDEPPGQPGHWQVPKPAPGAATRLASWRAAGRDLPPCAPGHRRPRLRAAGTLRLLPGPGGIRNGPWRAAPDGPVPERPPQWNCSELRHSYLNAVPSPRTARRSCRKILRCTGGGAIRNSPSAHDAFLACPAVQTHRAEILPQYCHFEKVSRSRCRSILQM